MLSPDVWHGGYRWKSGRPVTPGIPQVMAPRRSKVHRDTSHLADPPWGSNRYKVASHEVVMTLFDLREPLSAWSHGAGMTLSIPLTWLLWRRWRAGVEARVDELIEGERKVTPYERGKLAALLIFGLALVICYGSSALYHSVQLSGERLSWYRRLDHVGIYLLIAGTYTPPAWCLLQGGWRRGTLISVWSVAAVCAGKVWLGGVLPPWVSTVIYMGMGWGVLFCYRELAREPGPSPTAAAAGWWRFLQYRCPDQRVPLAGPQSGGLRIARPVPPVRDRGEPLTFTSCLQRSFPRGGRSRSSRIPKWRSRPCRDPSFPAPPQRRPFPAERGFNDEGQPPFHPFSPFFSRPCAHWKRNPKILSPYCS